MVKTVCYKINIICSVGHKYFHIQFPKTIPPNIGGYGNLNWLVKINSTEEFSQNMEEKDLPIDSNFFLYSGNMSEIVTLYDVYRPDPSLDLRKVIIVEKK